jgi:hypothetical protein
MTWDRPGMILDRALTPELLDVAFRVARVSGDRPDARRLLTVALRDHVSAQEAEGKTKKCLTRVWVHPPKSARPMIRWVIDHADLDPDRRVIHYAALLATFPFVGAVTAIIGRSLTLQANVLSADVRGQARMLFGDRSTIDVGARKVYTTLRYLGLLHNPTDGLLVATDRVVVPSALAGWVAHALLLTRQLGAIDTRDLSPAPELFALKTSGNGFNVYPLLESHTEGDRRTVLVPLPTGSQ